MSYSQFYIGGRWTDPSGKRTGSVINPATEEKITDVLLADRNDVDRAVNAAADAFPAYAATSANERMELLKRILSAYKARYDEIADAITLEVGAPISLSKRAQAATGVAHLEQAIDTLKRYEFVSVRGKTTVSREPVGVCGLITPWNWPINQIMCKVAAALAAG